MGKKKQRKLPKIQFCTSRMVRETGNTRTHLMISEIAKLMM
jgi:hypothetical protein